MKASVKSILLGTLLVCGFLAGCKDQPKTRQLDTFDNLNVKEISGWRILRVDNLRKSMALDILVDRPVVALSDDQVIKLFPSGKPDPSALLRNELQARGVELEKLEKDLAKPAFVNNAAMKDDKRRLKNVIEYLSQLKDSLRPYLLMAKLCSGLPDSGFTAFIDLRTGSLSINQGCLSHSNITPWLTPVVVYSEKAITEVLAFTVVDE